MTLTFISLACLAILPANFRKPELLPELPEKWSHERLELPLEFAPDLSSR